MEHSELVKKHGIVLVGNLTQAWHNLPTAPHGPRKPRPCTAVHAPNVVCSDGKAGHRQRQHGSHEQHEHERATTPIPNLQQAKLRNAVGGFRSVALAPRS